MSYIFNEFDLMVSMLLGGILAFILAWILIKSSKQ